MEDLPTALLTQQEHARARTGEELETFGKHASKLYLRGKCETLSEAVVEAVKTAGLSPEQVKRVVEFANTSTYLEKFASEDSTHKVINFEGGPASFPDVIRDLNDGGGGSVYDSAQGDYSLPPPDVEKMAAANLARLGFMDGKLASAFAVDEIPLPYGEPLRDAIDMKDKLASLYDEAMSELGSLETRYMDLCDLMFGQVKQASLEGVPLGQLVPLFASVTEDPAFLKAAFAELGPRLVDNRVFETHDAMSESLMKTAGAGMPNPQHPLVGIYADFCETLAKLAATRQVSEDVVANLDTLQTFIKKASAATAGESVGKVLGAIPKAWRAVTGAAAHASQPVEQFVEKAVGPNAAWAASRAVKYAPHAATALAGEEVYQRAKANPAIQGAENFVLSRLPYTRQNMARQYNLQMGY